MKKVITLVLTLCLLASVISVCFTTTVSAAITEADGLTTAYTWGLECSHDFSAGGVEYARQLPTYQYTTDGDNPVFMIGNSGTGGQAYFDSTWGATKRGTAIRTVASQASTAYALALTSGKTYRVTFDYKILSGSNTGVLSLYTFGTSFTGTSPLPLSSRATILSSTPASYTFPENVTTLEANTEWMTATYIFTVGGSNIFIGMRPEASGEGQVCNAYIDNFKVERATSSETVLADLDNEYVFNYADADVQADVATRLNALTSVQAHYSLYNWNGYAASTHESYPGASEFTTDGLKLTVGKTADFSGEASTSPCNALVYNTGAGNDDGWLNGGAKYLRLRDDASYIVTVKYKVTQVTTRVTLGVGTISGCVYTDTVIVPDSTVRHEATTDEWQYLTATVDTGSNTALTDKLLTVSTAVPSGEEWAAVVIASITVEEKRDTVNGEAFVKTVNGAEKNVDLVSAGVKYTLADAISTNANDPFDGWYTTKTFDEGTKVDAANYIPSTGMNTLYAKFASNVADYELVNQGSIREEDANADPYVSAGIRFKGRVTEAFRASATEIGFYAVPTAALNGASIADYLAADGAMAISAKVKAEDIEEEIVYEVSTDNYGTKFYDYQMIITGLTRKGETASLLGTEITCVMYMITNGQTVYSNAISYSYNQVAGIQ